MAHVRSIYQVKKYWATLLFGTFTTIVIYLVLHARSYPMKKTPLPTPTQVPLATNGMMHQDRNPDDILKLWYPVEHALLDLFPKETSDVMATMSNDDHRHNNNNNNKNKNHHQQHGNILNTTFMNWLLRRRRRPFSWSHYYRTIDQQDNNNNNNNSRHPSYQCQDVPLPYPILRHMIKQALQLAESTKPNYPFMFHSSSESPDLTKPFILLPFAPEDRPHGAVSSGQPICIRAIIPPSVLTSQNHPTTPFHYRYQPYSSLVSNQTTTINTGDIDEQLVWWDMIQVSSRHLTTNASMTFTMTPWHGHKTLRDGYQKKWFEHEDNIPNWSRRMMQDMDERGWLHVYETNAVWRDPGKYLLDGKLEFQDAYWNTDLGPVQPYRPYLLPVVPSAHLKVKKRTSNNNDNNNQPPADDDDDDDVKQLVLEHLELPLCQGGKADHGGGRWLPWPFGNNLVDASRMVAGLDKHNKFWAPTYCRYRPISHQQFHRCLAQRFPKGLNIYGDSNMRRSIKSFLSHGQWCKDYHLYYHNNSNTKANKSATAATETKFTSPQHWEYLGESNQLRACHCEDFKEATWNPAWFNASARRWDLAFENTDEESRQLGQGTEWDIGGADKRQQDGVRVSSYKWDGLTFMNDQGWQAGFTKSAYTLPSNTDVVMLSLVNWDMAYMQLEEFRQGLELLVQHLKTQYYNNSDSVPPPKPLLIYRTPQYYCCRVDQSTRQRKSNTARMKIFDQVARQTLHDVFDDGDGKHWIIWDVMMMGEARTWDEKMETSSCGANHAQADVVHLENQVLMNALCNPS